MSDFDKLANALEKSIGANDAPAQVKYWLDTGLPELNAAASGRYDGGFPVGRIVEISGDASSGKTVIATRLMTEAQASGGIAAFHDHERTFSEKLAERNGLSLERGRWLYKKPDTFEDSFEMFAKAVSIIRESKLIPEDAPICYVFDSFAAMIPASQFGKDFNKLNMNDTTALARVASQVMKQVAVIAEKYNVLVIILNQVREKPGVCLRGDAVVPFVDGTSATISEIVKKRISKEVWSYNENTGEVEKKKITQWHDNGEITSQDEWVSVQTTGRDTSNGRKSAVMTKDHKVLTKDGWKRAGELRVGDKIVSKTVETINGSYRDFLEACMMGDCGFSRNGNRLSSHITIRDNNDPEYAKWKVGKLMPFISFKKKSHFYNGKNLDYFISRSNHELGSIAHLNRSFELAMSFKITPMSMSIWIMDDGSLGKKSKLYSICMKRFTPDQVEKVADKIFEEKGWVSNVNRRERKITFNVSASREISRFISEYVPPFMDRKLLAADRGKFKDYTLSNSDRHVTNEEEVVSLSPVKHGEKEVHTRLYDIGVEDNHSFLVGARESGYFVHNCYGDNKDTAGGKALKFYASIRISLSSSKIKNGDEIIGNHIRALFIKNKVTRPFARAEYDFIFREDGTGDIDNIGSTLEFMGRKGLIEKAGSYYKWGDKKMYMSAIKKEVAESGGMKFLESILEGKSVDVDIDKDAEAAAERLKEEGLADLEGI